MTFVPEEKYMLRAIELAIKGEGYVSPNPMVGAVIVKDGRIIGEGYHKRYGDLHAERSAFASLTEPADGACIYVTLEPCCHHGKQPPCTEAIIEHKIKRVVIGSYDPNPLVSGKGMKILRDAGIEVVEDFMRKECDAVNPVFFKYITSGCPYVVLKYAMTMDGKIATRTGASKWITGEKAREEVQHLRHKYMAIMAGIGTVQADDPMLNVRIQGLKSPIRVIIDSRLLIPQDSRIVKSAGEYRTMVFYCKEKEDRDLAVRKAGLEAAGVEAVAAPSDSGQVDIKWVFDYLGKQAIDSVLIEGGGTLNDSILRAGLVDRVEAFIGPKVFGGENARTPVCGLGAGTVEEAVVFKTEEVKKHGDDVQITYVRA